MIVVMKTDATDEMIVGIERAIRGQGLRPQVIRGTNRTVVAAIGEKRGPVKERLERMDGVADVVPILAPYKLACREVHPEPTTVRVGTLQVGGRMFGMIAGPCSIESEEQMVETAKAVKKAGATAIRGGAFKPRTSPYAFRGLHERGLELLDVARQETGLPVVTELLAEHDAILVAKYADVIQIGARNMQNYRLLEVAGQIGKPILLKRGPAATLEELLLAAEYILNTGNPDVILCERGIRTFETHTRFTLPLASVEYLHQKTHLPVIVDPSHATGIASLVPSSAMAAIAAGADGLIVEVHPEPAKALCDGAQSLSFPQFRELTERCRRIADVVGKQWAGSPEETGKASGESGE
ncbi:MAG: 3-deoxy-7-phosphoheptulonate synthase [Planctomycetia bacterium]|nr:3-deoxy-7-phosphoheptulonate synthase [Planctomycetia bacterium]